MLQLNHQKPGLVTIVPGLVEPACHESFTTDGPYTKVTAAGFHAGFEGALTLFVMGDRHTSAGSAPLAMRRFVGIFSSLGQVFTAGRHQEINRRKVQALAGGLKNKRGAACAAPLCFLARIE